MEFQIEVAGPQHYRYAEAISELIESAARARGTGIAVRPPAYIRSKIEEGKAIIALQGETLAGFCYIETWNHGQYAANSGLIVAPAYRNQGLAKQIKGKAFELSRQKYPGAKLFGITTSLAVMKINTELGYKPVTFSELTTDDVFWQGCQSCPNYDVLTRTQRKMCLCTGMLYDPVKEEKKDEVEGPIRQQLRKKLLIYRLMQERVHDFLDAVNRQDMRQAMTYLTDDFRMYLVREGTVLERSEVPDLLAWHTALHGHLDEESLEIGDDAITGIFSVRNDLLPLVGAAAVPAHLTCAFGPNGNIRALEYEQVEGAPTFDALLQPALEWAAEFRPEDRARLFEDGRPVRTAGTAGLWKALLRAWRAEVPADTP